ncbi:histidinol dehydrogenase [Lasius niger]|uniref:Histidinol dehydrogenase n=1 Tax=Lasius niger TaxID=67767 RepID=A0A0J7KU52_LASNI|nr:histidinol dehydrogenase [Lasius niger]
MVRRHVLSVIFLALVSANVIQAGVIPLGLFHHEALPNFINLLDIPRIGGFASSAASAVSNALHGFRSYFDDFHTGLGGPDGLLHGRFINGGILPGLAHSAILNGAADTVADAVATSLVPSTDHLIGPGFLRRGLLGRGLLGRSLLGRGLLGNYGVGGLGGDAASAAAAGSAAAGA